MTHDTMLDHPSLVANDRHIGLQPPMEQLEQHEDSGRQTIMKAVVCKAYGPPESLAVEEIESLLPGRNQAGGSVKACGVNFPDTLVIQGLSPFKPPPPRSPGAEVAGIVQAGCGGVGTVKAGA